MTHFVSSALRTLLLAVPFLYADITVAAVSSQEAAELGKSLTPMGAERAGNQAGTIPAWTGGYNIDMPGSEHKKLNEDPYPQDKVLYSISQGNMDKYAGQLTNSVKRLLQTYPEYRLDVYPTHRSASAPDWLYQYTRENAVTAELKNNDKSVINAYGGVPFPIPKTGGEVVWNHILSWKGSSIQKDVALYLVDRSGRLSLTSTIETDDLYRYFTPGGKEGFDGFWQLHRGLTTGPGRSAGEALVGVWPIDFEAHSPGSWQYMPGQRRVRKLPNVQFDTPNFYVSGLMQFDEAYGWFGSPEQYHWDLIGKQEMYIPYNTNKMMNADPEKAFGKGFIDPAAVRWELHRVWVVEGKVRDSVRNTVARRRIYVDEDSWNVVAADLWDGQDQLYRGAIAFTGVHYQMPGVIAVPFQAIDFQQQAYTVGEFVHAYDVVDPKPRSYFTAESLVQGALR